MTLQKSLRHRIHRFVLGIADGRGCTGLSSIPLESLVGSAGCLMNRHW